MDSISYKEKQQFGLWVYCVIVAISVVGILVYLRIIPNRLPVAGPVICAVLVLFMLNIMSLRTTISVGELRLRLGALFPVFRKRIPLADVKGVRCVKYRPLRDAGGWGFRCGRFEGRKCRFYNARGNMGALVETHEGQCIIGSQTPEQLKSAIEEALNRSSQTAS
ncbi:hypothetical protein ACFL1X_11685 [Candidatus Hydrogenedentota bacterium]